MPSYLPPAWISGTAAGAAALPKPSNKLPCAAPTATSHNPSGVCHSIQPGPQPSMPLCGSHLCCTVHTCWCLQLGNPCTLVYCAQLPVDPATQLVASCRYLQKQLPAGNPWWAVALCPALDPSANCACCTKCSATYQHQPLTPLHPRTLLLPASIQPLPLSHPPPHPTMTSLT